MTMTAERAAVDTAPFIVGDKLEILWLGAWHVGTVTHVERIPAMAFGRCWLLHAETRAGDVLCTVVDYNGRCYDRPGVNSVRGHVED